MAPAKRALWWLSAGLAIVSVIVAAVLIGILGEIGTASDALHDAGKLAPDTPLTVPWVIPVLIWHVLLAIALVIGLVLLAKRSPLARPILGATYALHFVFYMLVLQVLPPQFPAALTISDDTLVLVDILPSIFAVILMAVGMVGASLAFSRDRQVKPHDSQPDSLPHWASTGVFLGAVVGFLCLVAGLLRIIDQLGPNPVLPKGLVGEYQVAGEPISGAGLMLFGLCLFVSVALLFSRLVIGRLLVGLLFVVILVSALISLGEVNATQAVFHLVLIGICLRGINLIMGNAFAHERDATGHPTGPIAAVGTMTANVMTYYRRELAAYFLSPIAYIISILFVLVMNALALLGAGPGSAEGQHFFERGVADMEPWFMLLPWVFLFVIPAVAMRLWAEERQIGSLEQLLTMPATTLEVMFGKFLASWSFIAVMLMLTFPFALMLGVFGDPDGGQIIASYIGGFLLGGAFLSVGMLMSATTKDQIIAFMLGVVVCGLFVLIGHPAVEGWLSGLLSREIAGGIAQASLSARFTSIGRGVLDLADLLYYVLFIGFFLYLTYITLELKRQ